MGNCLFGGNEDMMVKVVTSTGGIMEFVAPVTVEFIAEEFPGHGIFRSHDLFWKPLPAAQVLLAGDSYYLLPLNKQESSNINIEIGHVRSSNSVPQIQNLPYRMSFDSQGRSQALYRGFWKVKLVITPKQLLEILSQETTTQEFIENVTTVAKCGKTGFSDSWSLSSSRNTTSHALFSLE
ncbi:hypothetical protein KY290_011881 [Solanum tuberosum]|uniref:Uncharacterized protein n=1 Tax=Solanum tuberosum TaxID=4113 RepID=A0ABQ7W1X6_SOLTU|nr:hypothetical protein KY289_012365 [Solanum tuberosum]KAH0710548.1 hypothetical protein KY284_011975 [Solanum tuberosum]KAH0736204.1 hypothetical protein KY285_011911 [Solanum tuberosum]KAH0774744.1 hypothetical protein KY290_011881 [Solanum tuberosum]